MKLFLKVFGFPNFFFLESSLRKAFSFEHEKKMKKLRKILSAKNLKPRTKAPETTDQEIASFI